MTELVSILKRKAGVARKRAQEHRANANLLEGLARGFEESIVDIQKANGAMPAKKQAASGVPQKKQANGATPKKKHPKKK